jgi:hypothetical protein
VYGFGIVGGAVELHLGKFFVHIYQRTVGLQGASSCRREIPATEKSARA